MLSQSCLTDSSLCDPNDCSPPSSSVHGIFQQECWSGLPFPAPGNLPELGTEPTSPSSPVLVDSLPLPPGKLHVMKC